MRLCFTVVPLFALTFAATAQDPSKWDSLAKLKPGDDVRVSLKTGSPVAGEFRNWTSEQVQVGPITTPKQDVLRLERYHAGRWSRGKRAAIGAVIGFTGGFVTGAAIGGCQRNQFGPCISRGALGGAMGGAGAAVGAVVGAVLPSHRRELIYRAP